MTDPVIQIGEIRDAALDCAAPALPPGVVHLWQRSLSAPASDLLACQQLLRPDEREKAGRYRVERPRADYILTRGTLRSLLSGYLGIPAQDLWFRYSRHGKPYLEGSELQFNVSHTEGLALLGFVRDRRIGVDVERVRAHNDVRALAKRFFSARERDALGGLDGEELHAAFFRCWTRKEAYIKARGEGLSLPLDRFDVSIAPDSGQALLATRPDAREAGHWAIHGLPVASGLAAAVAYRTGIEGRD